MAVTQYIPGSAVDPWGGTLDERGIRRYRRTDIVITDDPQDGPVVASNAPGMPIPYSAYQSGNDIDLGATLKVIDPQRRSDTLLVWDVHLEWNSETGSEDQGQRDPTLRRPKKRWSDMTYEVVQVYDLYGNAIMNGAKDQFDPPVMGIEHGLRFTYQKNFRTEQEVAFCYDFLYNNATNTDPFLGFLPFTAKMTGLESEETFNNDINAYFWDTTLTFEFRKIIINPRAVVFLIQPNGTKAPVDRIYPWNKTVVNVGFNEIKTDGTTARILGSDNRPVPQPARLNVDGSKMFAQNPIEDTVYFSWVVGDMRPFAPLGII